MQHRCLQTRNFVIVQLTRQLHDAGGPRLAGPRHAQVPGHPFKACLKIR